jgi:hypothetical protein
MSVTIRRRPTSSDITFHPVLDLPGGGGPTGRRLYKDDDGTLVGELVDEITGATYRSCAYRHSADDWTILLYAGAGWRDLVDRAERVAHRDAKDVLRGMVRRRRLE